MVDKELNKQALSIIMDIRKAEKSGDRIPLYQMTHIEARNAYLAMRESLSPPPPKVYQVKNFVINKNGKLVQSAHSGKVVKGKFIRFLAQNNVQDIYGVKNFEYDGYKWNGQIFLKKA